MFSLSLQPFDPSSSFLLFLRPIHLSQILRELVPMDMLRAYTPDDWRKAITSHYAHHKSRAPVDAKTNFLKYISKWPTFGSAFFEVKVRICVYVSLCACLYMLHSLFLSLPLSPSLSLPQQTTEPKFPDVLLIAINKQGVMLINPYNKVTYIILLYVYILMRSNRLVLYSVTCSAVPSDYKVHVSYIELQQLSASGE